MAIFEKVVWSLPARQNAGATGIVRIRINVALENRCESEFSCVILGRAGVNLDRRVGPIGIRQGAKNEVAKRFPSKHFIHPNKSHFSEDIISGHTNILSFLFDHSPSWNFSGVFRLLKTLP